MEGRDAESVAAVAVWRFMCDTLTGFQQAVFCSLKKPCI